MTPQQFQKRFEAKLKEISRYARQDLPRHIGKIAVDHFQENFMRGGYVDDKLQPWTPPKRMGLDKSAASSYGPLLSSRKQLYNSIRYEAGDRAVKIISSLPYSKIHNEGGQVTIPVTPRMRKFAWARHYQSGEQDSGWKGLALTKKASIVINIPQRRYMGKGIELNRLVQARIHKDVKRILLNS